MNAYEKSKRAQARRVARGVTRLVRVMDLQEGDILHSHQMTFDHLDEGRNENVVNVRFTNGYGYIESADAEVEVLV